MCFVKKQWKREKKENTARNRTEDTDRKRWGMGGSAKDELSKIKTGRQETETEKDRHKKDKHDGKFYFLGEPAGGDNHVVDTGLQARGPHSLHAPEI